MNPVVRFKHHLARAFALSGLVLFFSGARADVVLAWNELLLHIGQTSSDETPPQLEMRAIAIAHLAMDEAVTSVSSAARDESGRLAAQRAAAVSAAQVTLTELLPGHTAAFAALAQRHLAAIPDGADKERGIDAGRSIARRTLALRQQDGWGEVAFIQPNHSEFAAQALARGEQLPPSPWLSATPFVIKTAQQFSVSEVRNVTRYGTVETDPYLQRSRLLNRVDQQAAIATREGFWAQRPVVVWNRIARQLGATRNIALHEQARLLAMLNVALADALLSTLHWRHTIGGWRVVAADIWGTGDGMPPRFSDLYVQVNAEFVRAEPQRVLIPPTPNYPSVSATLAGAAQSALTSFFKTDQVAFTLPRAGTGGNDPGAPRTFASISAAARECAYVASLDGHHMREACIAGYTLGTSIGSYVSKRPRVLRR